MNSPQRRGGAEDRIANEESFNEPLLICHSYSLRLCASAVNQLLFHTAPAAPSHGCAPRTRPPPVPSRSLESSTPRAAARAPAPAAAPAGSSAGGTGASAAA